MYCMPCIIPNSKLSFPPCRRPRVLFSSPRATILYTLSRCTSLNFLQCTVVKDQHLLRRVPCPQAHDKDIDRKPSWRSEAGYSAPASEGQ